MLILLRVIFFTLLERKILRYRQSRVGPNKVSLFGILQPLLDGLKLILNEKTSSYKINKRIYYFGPFILFIVIIALWIITFLVFNFFSLSYYLLYFMACLGLSIYRRLLRGWASNSKYSIIGGIRALAQTLSYELTLIFCILIIFSPIRSFNFNRFIYFKFFYLGLLIPILIIWIINILAECGRAPFDFIEGERELVRGFNTEFSRRAFAVLFVGEYGVIIFFSLITSFLFFNFKLGVFLRFFGFLRSFLFIRSSFPRFRYDFLMNLAWIKLLPLRIFYLGFTLLIFL